MLNQLILQGRLTKDCDVKQLESGTTIVSFTLATDNRRKDDSSFINCVAFDKVGENLSKYCKKGDMVCIIGAVNQRKYVNKDGDTRNVFEVIVDSVEFLQPKKEEAPMPNPDEIPPFDDLPEDIRNLEGTSKELPPLPKSWHYEDGKPVKDAVAPKSLMMEKK